MPKSLKVPKLHKKTAEELLWDIKNLSKYATTTDCNLVERYCIAITLFADHFILKPNPKKTSTTDIDLDRHSLATMPLTDQFVMDMDSKLDVFRDIQKDFDYRDPKKFTLKSLLSAFESKKIFFEAQSNMELPMQVKESCVSCAKGCAVFIEHLKETIQMRKYAIEGLNRLRLFSNNQLKEHDQRLVNSDFGMGSSTAQGLLKKFK